VIKLEDRRQKKPLEFEEVKDRIIGSLVQSKAQEMAGSLRGGAKIEYVDEELRKQAEIEAIKAAVKQKTFEKQIDQQLQKEGAPGKQ
jgi:hypothetical protein